MIVLGFVFPGQGAQSVGMLSELAASEPLIAATLSEAEAAAGLPLVRYMSEGPAAELDRTEVTQPAVMAASVALWRLWRERGGPLPEVVAGHSLGEYTALVCADALDFADGIRLVRARGQYMQEAVPQGEGAIAAILGLDDDQVRDCCAKVDGIVSPANYNAPGQVAVAGEYAAVEAAISLCKDAGAKRAVMLNLSVPVHCELMQPAADRLADAIEQAQLRLPKIPLIHNCDAQTSDSVDAIKQRLLTQLSQPVLWVDCVQAMRSMGATSLIECGPGKVLAGLIKRIERKLPVAGLDGADAITNALSTTGA